MQDKDKPSDLRSYRPRCAWQAIDDSVQSDEIKHFWMELQSIEEWDFSSLVALKWETFILIHTEGSGTLGLVLVVLVLYQNLLPWRCDAYPLPYIFTRFLRFNTLYLGDNVSSRPEYQMLYSCTMNKQKKKSMKNTIVVSCCLDRDKIEPPQISVQSLLWTSFQNVQADPTLPFDNSMPRGQRLFTFRTVAVPGPWDMQEAT